MTLIRRKYICLFLFLLYGNIANGDDHFIDYNLTNDFNDENNELENLNFDQNSNMSFDSVSDEIDFITKYEPIKTKVITQINTSYTDALRKLLLGGIDELLSQDLYLKTHTILKRPVTSLPIFEVFHTQHICQDWFFKFHIFGTQARAFYTNNSPFINSFLALSDPAYLEKLKKLKEVTNIDFEEALELFRCAKKDERRIGLLIQTFKNFNNFSFEFSIPFFYQEYNYFLTPEERENILNSSFFIDSSTKVEEDKLRQHAVSDKFGFGDAKIRLGFMTLKRHNLCAKIGIQSTIPIAFPFKKGIIGSFFKSKIVRPGINLRDVIQLQAVDTEAFDKWSSIFGMQVLNWLSAIVLDSPLGNYGHFGLGLFFEPNIKIDEGFSLKAKASAEYLFPALEERFFLTVKNPADFDHEKFLRDRDNEEAAKKDVLFLSEQVIETLFPRLVTAEIAPGFQIQITIAPQFRLNDWNFSIGYDFWYQQKEKVNFVFSPLANSFNIPKGTKSKAFQNKIFAAG